MLIAFGLAMDCFSVSITNGLNSKSFKTNNALKIAASFGIFQAIMPLFGWLAGLYVLAFISGFDHWLAFGILSVIGCRMIYESISADSRKIATSLSIGVLLLLSVATSIDALAVGLGLSFLRVAILVPAIVIGIVAFALSFLGVFIGDRFGHLFSNKVEILGGLILIVIGIKILIEHLWML